MSFLVRKVLLRRIGRFRQDGGADAIIPSAKKLRHRRLKASIPGEAPIRHRGLINYVVNDQPTVADPRWIQY